MRQLTQILCAIKLRVLQGRGVLPVFRILEAIVFGTRVRADILDYLLKHYYLSKFRRDWLLCDSPPHFEDNRCFLHLWYLSRGTRWPLGRNPDFLARGLFNREVMRAGDRVLDICCGDGFFDFLFYSGIAGQVDAIDIDRSAIAMANRYHLANNVSYRVLDCVKEELPQGSYDVVVWDGAIAHFTKDEVANVMAKIKNALGSDGILVGSEALETWEGKTWDHHLAFPEPADLRQFLLQFFPHVLIKEIPPIRGRYREAYFRCGDKREELDGHQWS